LSALEAQTTVAALGITDYMSIGNYRRIRSEKAGGRLPNILLMFPNIEFRITPTTRNGGAINIHLLISPDDSEHENEVDRALQRLTIDYKGYKYSCQDSDLKRLGRTVEPTTVASDKAALRAGANQFKVDFTAFKNWYESEGWLKRNSIIAVAAGQQDGVSGIQHDDGFKATRTEIYRFANMIYSGNPKDRDYWLGKTHGGEAEKVYGRPKPCIHGSDAHDLNKLLNPDQKRFCWIKADLTFEGLRQAIYEPEERIWIGEEPPSLHDKSRTIKSISFSDSVWFEARSYDLNPGLVSIIGQKGMGKSAINDLVAFAAGSWQDNDRDSFIDKARPHIKDMGIKLTWGDGRLTSITVPPKGIASSANEVRYLSQKFVERLCADHASSGELTREIESVVFSYLAPTETLNTSNFADLREKRTSGVITEQRRIQEELHRLHREISSLYAHQLSLPDRKAKVEEIKKERDGILAQLPAATTDIETEIAEKLESERAKLALLIDSVSKEKENVLRLDRLSDKLSAFRNQIDRTWADLKQDAVRLKIPADEWEIFKPVFPERASLAINSRKEQVMNELTLLEGSEEKPSVGTVKFHQAEVLRLSELTTLDEAKRKRISDIRNRVSLIETDIRRINTEIDNIENNELEQLKSLRSQRRETYYSFFETINKEKKILADLYQPLQKHLSLGQEEERRLDFSIRLKLDVEGWVEKGWRLFNQRKTLPHRTFDEMLDKAKEFLEPAWISGDKDLLSKGLDGFLAPYGEAGRTVGDYLKPSQTAADFFDWLYSTDHISLTYGLNYNDTVLENLSPGTKGIVLLILYLAMDNRDTRPLLIDQPEENLDNESIYSLLANYFRQAKVRRQIFLITHNPNLVVNTDADQIIVAHCSKDEAGKPSFKYTAGALENCHPVTGIRSQVCSILEGGAAAFQKREKRYSLN